MTKSIKESIHGNGKAINLEQNNFFHLKDSMVIYSIYNSDTLEKLINTVHKVHNKTACNEKIFVGKLNNSCHWYLSKDGVDHYAMNSVLYITTIREKYVRMYEKFISQLQMYANVMRLLLKGYLPNFLLPQQNCKKF